MGPKFPFCSHTDPPSVSAVKAVVLAAIGNEAVLVCDVSGVPPPRVVWYRGTSGGPSGAPQKGSLGGLTRSGGTPLPQPSVPTAQW